MDSDRYLGRIGYSGPRDATAATLKRLHERHMLSVPFENLDVGRRPIVIDQEAFVRKIVDEHRGGFCYELNGAFAALLRAFGFEVQLLSAGVAREGGGFGPDFDHLALLVTAEGEPWLADVGFGDSFIAPLRFEPDREQIDAAGVFRLWVLDDTFVLERLAGETWTPQYRFTMKSYPLSDFAARCDYHQSSPLSSFTQKSVCSLPTLHGRLTLSGKRLITTANDQRSEEDLGDEEWRHALRERFGIVLPF